MYLNVQDKWVSIKQHITTGIQSLFPVTTNKGSIDLISVEFKEPDTSIAVQRDTLISGQSLTCNVYGTFVKRDAAGKELERAKVKILDLPVVTHRGTFIVLGKDYAVFNQLRLKPGVYTKKSEDSGDVTTSFNLGKGLGFKLLLSPSDGVFYVRFDKSKASASTIKIPLYSLLKVLGISDDELKHRWGDKIYANNVGKSHLIEDAHKLVQATVYEGKRTGNDVDDLRNYFRGTALDNETTKVTLGNSYDKVEAGALLDAASKMVRVYSGSENEDDMDSLLFKEVLSVEDHLMLRIEKGIKETNNINKIKAALVNGKPLRECIPTNFLTRLIETFFTKSSLSSPQSEINPIEVLETNHKITAMGEGGIKSEHGIPMSARNLHPSHFGFLDPVRTTESTRVGVDLRTTQGAVVKNRSIYAPFLDRRGNKVMVKPLDLAGKVIGFSGQEGKKTVRVLYKGEMLEMPREKVDYWMDDPKDTFTYTSNLTPFMHNDQGNRITMASRFETQAVPLVDRDEPFVQVKNGDSSVEHDIGASFLSPVAPEDGTVTEVTDNYIKVNDKKVDIYHIHPLNLKTFLTMYPTVKVGEKVKKGQRLADSNFTKNGTLALGANLNTAYISYKGWNHEDGIVISESAAKKLTSQHMYAKEVDLSESTYLDKNRFIQLFPSKVSPIQSRKLDEDGVALKGLTFEKGDPVILALGKKDLTKYDMMLSRIQGALANPYRDAAEYWDHDRPGTVSDVVRTGTMVKVVFTTEDEMRVGDKLSNRHGGKGTVTLILPDSEMPKTADGKPVDQLLNPAGVISRVNAGQLYETMAGKIAQKTGKTYYSDNFSKDDSSKLLTKQLKENHLKMEEPLYDGKTGKVLGDVFIGNQYTLKLHKMTEGNFAARSTKAYDVNKQPARGGEAGAKAVGLQDVYALLGHNARANLHEMASYKSQDNAEFWNAVRLGLPIPKAKEPFAFEKFKAIVGASGIDVRKGDNSYTITPISDKQISNQSNGAITSGTLLVSGIDKYKAEQGGLFDERITGGSTGRNWSHIELAEPIINPLFSNIVKTLLHDQDVENMKPSEIKTQLAKINVDKRIAVISSELKATKGVQRDKLLKEFKYLNALKKMGMKPEDYVLTKFPVIPPQFRPIYDSQTSGAPMVSDVNYLYRDMINVNNELKALKDFPEADPTKVKLRKALQQAAGAVVGTEKPVNKKSEKHELQGYMPMLTGSKIEGGGTSKESFFHRKIMKRNQDMTGRGTILPDPNLHIDNVKIPLDMAHELYKPFVINNLVRHGYNVPQAMQEVKNKSQVAMQALDSEMASRPVLLNRAPTLHKYNILAFKPIPVEGKSIFIPPLVIKGFAADFDGDSVAGDTNVLVCTDTGRIELKEIKDV